MTAAIASLDKKRRTKATATTDTAASDVVLLPLPAEWYDPAVPLDSIDPDPANRHADIDDELIESIRTSGVIVPIVLRPGTTGRPYVLVAGERRWRASARAGRTTIPAIIRELSDNQAAIAQLIENLRRRDLRPAEEVTAVARCAQLGLTTKDLAAAVGASEKWVRTRIRLVELPPPFLQALETGRIRWEDADKAATLPPDTLTAIVKKQVSTWAIEEAHSKQAQERKAETLRRKLTKEGVRLADKGDSVERMFNWDMKLVKRHAGEPCHAVTITVNTWGVDRKDVCTNPDTHWPSGTSKLKRPDKQGSEHDARRVEEKARLAAYTDWCRNYLPRHKITQADIDTVLLAMLHEYSFSLQVNADARRWAVKITSIQLDKNPNDETIRKALETYARDRSTPTWMLLVLWLSAPAGSIYRSAAPQYKWATQHGFDDPHPEHDKHHDDNGDGDDD